MQTYENVGNNMNAPAGPFNPQQEKGKKTAPIHAEK